METTAIEMASTTEGAISVLRTLLSRPHPRANSKSTITATIDMALLKAIAALEKELKEENKKCLTVL